MTFKLFFYEKGFLSLLKNKKISDYEEYNIQNIQKKNLSLVQKKLLKEIIKNLQFKKYSTTLIHGVTGSGKTLIYFEIIKQALKKMLKF